MQNYPHPFNPSTIISYSIPEQNQVELTVFDMLGNKIATLVNEAKSAGNYNVSFNASNLSNGIYFYKLIGSEFVATNKLLLIK